jgi:hypothetical protein
MRPPGHLVWWVRVPRICPDVSKALAHRPRRTSPNRPPGSLRFSGIPWRKLVHRSIPWPDPNQNETGVSLD